MRRRALPEATAFVLFALLALAARWWSLEVPLSEDAGAYLYVADTIRDGGLPYVDAADNKGPLTYLLFGALDIATGSSTTGLRLTLVVACALAALAVAARVRLAAGPWAGLAAGVAMAILGSTPLLEGEDLNTEQYGVLPLAAAWWLAARGGLRSAAAAGALLAVAVLMNVGFAVLGLVIALELWLAPAAGRTHRLGVAALACVAVAAVPLAWLLASGAFDDMWIQVVERARIADAESGGFADTPLLDVPTKVPFALGLAGATLALAPRRPRVAGAAALLWIVICWLRVKLAPYEFGHHYYPTVAGVAAGMALGGAALWELLGERRGLRPAALAAAVLLAVFLAWRYVGEPSRDRFALPVDARVRFPQYALAYPVSDEVRSRTGTEDTVAVSGNHPTVLWRAERRAPTRFFAEYALVPMYVDEYRRGLRNPPPHAIVLMPGFARFGGELRELARANGYRRVWSREGASIWLPRG